MLEWLLAQGMQLDRKEDLCTPAARGGHVAVLEWLHAQGLQLDRNHELCTLAARQGHLAALKWLHALGCPLDKAECIAAVENDIKVRRGLPYRSKAFSTERHEEVLHWLNALGESSA